MKKWVWATCILLISFEQVKLHQYHASTQHWALQNQYITREQKNMRQTLNAIPAFTARTLHLSEVLSWLLKTAQKKEVDIQSLKPSPNQLHLILKGDSFAIISLLQAFFNKGYVAAVSHLECNTNNPGLWELNIIVKIYQQLQIPTNSLYPQPTAMKASAL